MDGDWFCFFILRSTRGYLRCFNLAQRHGALTYLDEKLPRPSLACKGDAAPGSPSETG